MIKKTGLYILLVIIGVIISVFDTVAQSFQYQPDKPGQFIFDNQLEKCVGVDVTSLQNELTSIVEWVRQHDPVIDHPIGFDAMVGIAGYYFDLKAKKEDFGIQSSIYFGFHDFFIDHDGVSKRATGNTAHGAEIITNSPMRYISSQFDEAEFQTDDPPHLKQALEKALANLKRYYTTAPVIKEIAPGVRLYDPGIGNWFKGSLLVFNPDQPDIWIPVTVKEIMEAKLAYYKVKKEIDRINQEKMLAVWGKMNFKPDSGQVLTTTVYDKIKMEFENFTTEELNRPAFSSSEDEFNISTINASGEGRAVVRFNPACWDSTLPVTAVQFISMEYRPATTVELEEFIPRNGGLHDFVGLFFNSLPIEKMGILIQHK